MRSEIKIAILLFLCLIIFISCSTETSFIVNNDINAINQALTNSIKNIDQKIRTEKSFYSIDGPGGYNAKVNIQQLNENSFKLTYKSMQNLEYSENLFSIFSQELNNEPKIKNSKFKSYFSFNIFNLISPGLGSYYLKYNSFYSMGSKLLYSICLIATDYWFISNSVKDSKDIIWPIILRTEMAVVGNYFVKYENIFLKAGYQLKF